MEQVSFKKMEDGTVEDYALLHKLERDYIDALPDRLMAALQALDNSLAGYQVSRLTHSLQSATRAEADGADIELIVAALIHDLGDDLAPENHSQLAAAIIRPYVRAEVTWILEMHGVFQMKYYALIAVSAFAVIGIKPPLTLITPQSLYRILSRCCVKYSHAQPLIPTLSKNSHRP